MSSDDELDFLSGTGGSGPSLYTGASLSQPTYGVVQGPQDEVEVTLESDMDLFGGRTESSPFGQHPGAAQQPMFVQPPLGSNVDPAAPQLPLPPADEDEVEEEPEPDYDKAKIWEIEYYQRYFNVTALDILNRMGKSMVPYGDDFFTTISGRVDFWGAFWIPTTLIFFMAATGNFATYLACQDQTAYVASFLKVVWGAFAIYGYVLVLPLVLWGVFKWLDIPLGFSENLCLYGYSLTIYLPLAILAIIPNAWARFFLMLTGAIMVCVCLFRSYWSVAHLNRSASIGIAITLSLCNLALAAFFDFYLFQYHADDCQGTGNSKPTNSSKLEMF